ncbi:MAG: hypothetical protein QM607_04735 [Microbacterium sp.]
MTDVGANEPVCPARSRRLERIRCVVSRVEWCDWMLARLAD